MARTSLAVRLSPSPHGRSMLSGANGPPVEPVDRLARIESLLESIEKSLAVQFKRIADIQVQLDRAIADRPLPPER